MDGSANMYERSCMDDIYYFHNAPMKNIGGKKVLYSRNVYYINVPVYSKYQCIIISRREISAGLS